MDMYKNEDMDYEPAKMLAEFYVWWVPAKFLRKFFSVVRNTKEDYFQTIYYCR